MPNLPKRSKNHGYGQDGTRPSEEAAFELGVVYTTVKNQLVAFAAQESNPYTFADIAARVAGLLDAEALRQQYRSAEPMPPMWENGNSNRGGRRARSAEGMAADLSGHASGPRTLSKKARKAIANAQRERWAKFHAEREGHGVTVGFEKRAKRVLTPKQLKAMQRNIALGRAAKKGKKKYKMSPAARAKISAARKAYWATRKAAA